MSRYQGYKNPPVTYIEAAEAVLCGFDPDSIHDTADKIAYAQALISLAAAQMAGSVRA